MSALTHGKTLLFIGSNTGILKTISFAHQHAGFGVLWATNGRAALQMAGLENPDLIISETELPDISGFDMCRRMRKMLDKHNPPFILVGEIDNVENAAEAAKAGSDDFVSLSVDLDNIVETVLELIEKRQVENNSKRKNGTYGRRTISVGGRRESLFSCV